MISQLTGDHCSTAQFGQTINTKPESIRRGFCTQGHYLGLKPIKLDNGRLLWPVDGIKRILSGDQNGNGKDSDDEDGEEGDEYDDEDGEEGDEYDDEDGLQGRRKKKSGPASPH